MPEIYQLFNIFDIPEDEIGIGRTYAAQFYLQECLNKSIKSGMQHITTPKKKSLFSRDRKEPRRQETFDPLLLEHLGIYEHALDVNPAEFRQALKEMPEVNVLDRRNITLLHGLCLVGNMQLLEEAARAGLLLNGSDVDGFNALHYCAISDKAEMFEFVRQNAAQSGGRAMVLDQRGKGGRMPIHVAAVCGSTKVLKVLLDRYPTMLDSATMSDSNSRTPLWLATFYRNTTAAEFLLARSNFHYHETSEPEVSFIYRMGTRINNVALKLLDRSIVKCQERNINYYWLADSHSLINEAALRQPACTSNLDPGILLNPTRTKEAGYTSTLATLLDNPLFWNNLLFKWDVFGRYFYTLYVAMKWVYILLWTLIFLCDSTWFLESHSEDTIKGLLFIICGVISFILIYDYGRLVTSVLAVTKFRKHDQKVSQQERHKLHPKMWAHLFFSKHDVFKDDKLSKTSRAWLLWDTLKQFNIVEHLVDIASLISLIYCLTITLSGNSRKQKVPEVVAKRSVDELDTGYDYVEYVLHNEPRDYVISFFIVLQWFVGLTTLRVFHTFGYLIEVLKGIFWDLSRIGIFFLAIYIPLFAIFWDTIYSWQVAQDHTADVNTTEYSSKMITDQSWSLIQFTFFETFRKTHLVYDYDLGLQLAVEKGEIYGIEMDWWWYALHFYWVLVGCIVLINMLIALMGETTGAAQKKATTICMYNTMVFLAEVESMIPLLTNKWLMAAVHPPDGTKKLMEFPNTDEDLGLEDPAAKCKESLEELKGFMNDNFTRFSEKQRNSD